MTDPRFGEAFLELCEVMDRLRDPGGCAWDRAQTLESLKPFLLEETYEVLHALDAGDAADHCEELGDLLLQVVFQARLRSEQSGGFTVAEVCRGIRDKLVRRHPHVFGPAGQHAPEGGSASAVLDAWEAQKRVEKGRRGVLSTLPSALPSLARAQRVGEKVARVGFEWPGVSGVLAKVREELGELEEAVREGDRAHVRHELGDLLFSVVQLARHVGHSAEDALRETVERFTARFRYVELQLYARGRDPATSTLEEMDALWNEAKAHEKAGVLAQVLDRR